MVSDDQLNRMGYDRFGIVGDAELAYTLLPWLDSYGGVAASAFISSPGTGGLLAPNAGVMVSTPQRGYRPYAQVDIGLGLTGSIVRPLLRAGLGVDIFLSREMAFGPTLGYGQLFQPDAPEYSTDARFIWAGCALFYRYASTEKPRVIKTPKVVKRKVPSSKIPSKPVEPTPELLELIERTLPAQDSRVELLAPVLFAFDSDRLEPILEHSVFAIFSQTPIVVELENASLSGVTFSLRGDITLKIDRAVIFDGVTISSESEVERLPTLELIEIHGQRLFVGNGSKAFSGSFRATRSELDNCGIFARDVQFESVRIDQATIDTTILTGTDASLFDTVIGFQHAVLSASLLYRVEVPRCESLTTISSTIETTRISACSGSSYRAYSTDMIDVSLNGSIEIDKGYWEKVRFGSQQSTFVVGWDFELNAATFCEKSRSFRMGDSPTISCTRCETEFLHEPGAVCLLPGSNPIIAEQNCAVFVQPGDCPEPIPSRTRP